MLTRKELNTFFHSLSEALDIPDSYFEQARQRYQAIGNWLEREESIVSAYTPNIYPQGSFSLGTMIKPISNKDEYDIDLVCRLTLSKMDVTQKKLKELIGSELADYVSAHNMNDEPEPHRRSWRLNYADGAHFHLDVLPSIPEYIHTPKNEIAITDNQHPRYSSICKDWVCCNQIDYAEWFKNRMKVQFQIRQKQLAESLKARAADVPEYKIKTPLQRSIQILKRHRDMTYVGNPDNKPVSILITTLAAQAYDNEADILEGLVNIVTGMSDRIKEKKGILWVENPVNPSENFADKWQEYPERQKAFLEWLAKAEVDILEIVNATSFQTVTRSLNRQFGETVVNKALKDGTQSSTELPPTLNAPISAEILTTTSNKRPLVTVRKADKPWGNQ